MKRFSLILATVLFVFSMAVAQVPIPAPQQTQAILILGGKAHLGNGKTIENAAIAFEKGKISFVADATAIRIDKTKFGKIFDATGKHIYPGLIAPNTRLGLTEVEAVRATRDFEEIGEFNPNSRALVAYNTDSDIIPTVRSNGILLAQIVPTGGHISGTSSVVHLDAWNWEDAVVHADDALHLTWPTPFSYDWKGENVKNEKFDAQVQNIRQFFAEAKAYCQAQQPAEANPRFEAMRDVFSGKKKLFIHANHAKTIREAILLAEQYQCRSVLVGGNDAWLLIDFLKKHQIPVILSPTHRLPEREDEATDQPFRTPALLEEAGILYAFSAYGAWQQRNLPFQAGQAVGYGLDPEAAVKALTLNTATILGIDHRCGSLETGKDATLIITEGNIFDMVSARVLAAFIEGREISLDNKHRQLERRFREKYRQ